MTPRKVGFGTQLPPDLITQVRRAVVDLQRTDPTMTIARFTEEALTKALADLPDETPVQPAAKLRPGRRVRFDEPGRHQPPEGES